MTKKNKTPLGIFTEAIGLYFSNFKQFVKYMTFPVLGQIIGLIIIFSSVLIYSKNLPYLIEKYEIFNDFNMLVLFSVLVSIPGMIIFIKAFWEYLVAYGAVNSMLDNMLKSGKVYDFNAHTEFIKRRTPAFVSLWLILGIFSMLASFPLLWVPGCVIGIYLALVFQVFTYEPDLSPTDCIKKSFNLIKGHFASTFMLIVLAGILTWILIPQIFNYLSEMVNINKFIATAIQNFTDTIPLADINTFLIKFGSNQITSAYLASVFATAIINQIFVQYTLPLRSILCGLWYKELNGSIPEQKEKKKSSKKRPSEKLMENSHKRLDKNILKRAMEKDE